MNIYVGNLAYEVNEEDLKTAFSAFGAVSSSRVINDKFSGKSKGFGFVEMDVAADAQRAIEQLNGTDLKGRAIVVNEARPKPDNFAPRGGNGGGFRRDRGDRGGDRGGHRGGPGGGGRRSFR